MRRQGRAPHRTVADKGVVAYQDGMTPLKDEIVAIATATGDRIKVDANLGQIFLMVAHDLGKHGILGLDQEHVELAVSTAFQRRQDRFPDVPILNAAGFYADR